MSDVPRAKCEQMLRTAGAASRESRGLRERIIGRSIAERSKDCRESRLGCILSAAALTFLLALTVWKHAPPVAEAASFRAWNRSWQLLPQPPAVIHWSTPTVTASDDNASAAANNESHEWRHVRRSTERRQEVSQLLTRCFGS